MRTVFTLASGRSGTHFLSEIFRRSATDCAVRHETYALNPSMFGRPIYDRTTDNWPAIRRLVARKAWWIARSGAGAYVETSHAFLKSWSDLAPDFFPDLKLVRLIRDPLKVAKSEATREALLHRLHFPFRNYRGADGRRYFRWSLTGLEPIFHCAARQPLTRFQWYILQWIEIENRAHHFLDRFAKHSNCFTLHSPQDLNDQAKLQQLFDFLEIKPRGNQIDLGGRQNKNWRPTIITDDDRRQFAEVIRLVPQEYLAIFAGQPYRTFPWIHALRKEPTTT